MAEYSPAKSGEYPRIFPNFENRVRCEKDLKDNKDNSPYLGRKCLVNKPLQVAGMSADNVRG